MKDLLKSEFEQDPIYRMAILNGLEDGLFTEGILSMHDEMTYSTVEAGKIIERSDSTIRNHFRSDLIEYIQPEKFGKFYRLNYKSVFRLQLIFVLMEKAAKTSIDLLAELGMEPAVMLGGNYKRVTRPEGRELRNYEEPNQLDDRVAILEKNFGMQGIMLNILKYEKDISEIERKLENKVAGIEQIKTEAYMRYLEEKQAQIFATAMKKQKPKTSFFGLIKKTEEIDYSQVNHEIETNLKEKMKQETTEIINRFKEEINSLEDEKKKLESILEGEKKAFSNIQLDSNHKNAKLIDNP
ncbi:hypothetical protein [Bacillus sp. S3]|uniref:hypothetical protein n=1 Tax=Bacillus sp. S3 TaxID=486398 RepID=UPI001CC1F75C|nr:hypothetical protein [Bacillus sp. S3]